MSDLPLLHSFHRRSAPAQKRSRPPSTGQISCPPEKRTGSRAPFPPGLGYLVLILRKRKTQGEKPTAEVMHGGGNRIRKDRERGAGTTSSGLSGKFLCASTKGDSELSQRRAEQIVGGTEHLLLSSQTRLAFLRRGEREREREKRKKPSKQYRLISM